MSVPTADILFLETTPGAVLIVIVLAAWTAGLVDVIRRPDLERTQRLAWILLVVLLPILGTGLYFALRPREHSQHRP
jgi:hypothetical protein